MIEGLVSTIVPVYNRPKMLVEAVTSVLSQGYPDIEVIIVDDGSTDETATVASELRDQQVNKISLVSQSNAGPGRAREMGRLVARGEFIQYLDSDDVLLPGKFDRQIEGLRKYTETGASYGWTRYRHMDGRLEPEPWKGSGRTVESMFPSMLKERWWDTPTPLYRAEVLQRAGPWSDLRLEEDWEYDTRVAALGVRLHYCEAFVAEVRDHGDHRLCRGDALDRVRLRERARAHSMILSNAFRGGVTADVPEMQHFARELFLLARQCGAAGLRHEARQMFDLSVTASAKRSRDLMLYEAASNLLGWRRTGRIACWIDRFRHPRPESPGGLPPA